MPDKPVLMVATPCYGGVVTQTYMTSFLGLMAFGERAGWTILLKLLGYDSLITRSRNTLVSQFLDAPDATHLLFVDADIGFEAAQVARMLDFDEPVVAGSYPLKSVRWTDGALRRVMEGEPLESAPLRYVGEPCEGRDARRRDSFVTATYAGTGFMLIRRDAILRLIRANPHLRYQGTHGGSVAPRQGGDYALFDCMIDPATGIYLSEDFAFCRRWRDLGGTVWLDTEGRLTHVGPSDFHGRPDLRFHGPQTLLTAAAE